MPVGLAPFPFGQSGVADEVGVAVGVGVGVPVSVAVGVGVGVALDAFARLMQTDTGRRMAAEADAEGLTERRRLVAEIAELEEMDRCTSQDRNRLLSTPWRAVWHRQQD